MVNALAETRINVLPFGFGDILIKDRMDLFKIATPHIPQDQLNSILDTLGTDGKLPDDTSSIATDLASIICEGNVRPGHIAILMYPSFAAKK